MGEFYRFFLTGKFGSCSLKLNQGKLRKTARFEGNKHSVWVMSY